MMTLLTEFDVSKRPATSAARGKLRVTCSASTRATRTAADTAAARTHTKVVVAGLVDRLRGEHARAREPTACSAAQETAGSSADPATTCSSADQAAATEPRPIPAPACATARARATRP